MNQVMLYTGCAYDLFPIRRFSHNHKQFIYVDGLPDSKYFESNQHGYKKCKNINTMISAVIKDLQNDNAFNSMYSINENIKIFKTVTDIEIIFFFNLPDNKMKDCKELQEYLPRITSIYLSGFIPKDLPKLVNIKKCYMSNCIYECFQDELCDSLSKLKFVDIIDTEENEKGNGYVARCNYCSHSNPI
jgi:hypothetical protein